jgi:hypothetical protein
MLRIIIVTALSLVVLLLLFQNLLIYHPRHYAAGVVTGNPALVPLSCRPSGTLPWWGAGFPGLKPRAIIGASLRDLRAGLAVTPYPILTTHSWRACLPHVLRADVFGSGIQSVFIHAMGVAGSQAP